MRASRRTRRASTTSTAFQVVGGVGSNVGLSELQVFANETAVPSPIVSGSTYQIKQSTLAMDVPGSSTTNGTQLIVYGSNSGANQKFVITATTAGTYTIKNVN